MDFLTVPDHLSTRELTAIFSRIAVDPLTHCWNWTSYTTKGGYALGYFRRRHEMVHRVLFAWLVKAIPRIPRQHGICRDTPQLDHQCNNTKCCNPAHLELASARDNTLRGNSICAINARKTHCPKGHPLPTGPNLTKRECMMCRLVQSLANTKRYQERHRERHLALQRANYNKHRETRKQKKLEYYYKRKAARALPTENS